MDVLLISRGSIYTPILEPQKRQQKYVLASRFKTPINDNPPLVSWYLKLLEAILLPHLSIYDHGWCPMNRMKLMKRRETICAKLNTSPVLIWAEIWKHIYLYLEPQTQNKTPSLSTYPQTHIRICDNHLSRLECMWSHFRICDMPSNIIGHQLSIQGGALAPCAANNVNNGSVLCIRRNMGIHIPGYLLM